MKNRGITLITLVVAVSIMIIMSTMLIYNAKSGIDIRKLKYMQNDIALLNNKIDAYYIKNGALPIEIKYIGTFPSNFLSGKNDEEGEYYIIDLKALDGITLNYGEDFNFINTQEDTKTKNDVYIINRRSHHIYYAKGILLDGVTYYTNNIDEEVITKIIPKLSLEETGEKKIKIKLTTINGSKTEYNYKIYIKDNESGDVRVVKSGTTNEKIIETDEIETFFDIGIQDGYAEITYEGGIETTEHIQYEDLKIKYKNEFESFRDKVNNGKSYEGKTISQVANIDLQGNTSNNWIPIGTTVTNGFKGIYDGQSHSIQNLYIDTNLEYQGLFGYNQGYIKNLGIESGTIKGGNYHVGSIAGYNEGGTIEKCYNKVNIDAIGGEIGGICGSNQSGIIRQCYNTGNISATITKIFGGVYGIAGGLPINDSDTRIIEECYNNGNIKLISEAHNTRAAGIGEGSWAAQTKKSISIIRNCYNTGKIENIFTGDDLMNPPVAAGIAGQVEGENSKVENCYNIGMINIIAKYENNHIRRAGIVGCRVHEESMIINCYWLEGTANREYGPGETYEENGVTQFNQPEKIGVATSDTEMKNLTSALGASFKNDINNINNGYPILIWQ